MKNAVVPGERPQYGYLRAYREVLPKDSEVVGDLVSVDLEASGSFLGCLWFHDFILVLPRK